MIKVNETKTEKELYVSPEMMSNQCTCSNCTCKCVSQFSDVSKVYEEKE